MFALRFLLAFSISIGASLSAYGAEKNPSGKYESTPETPSLPSYLLSPFGPLPNKIKENSDNKKNKDKKEKDKKDKKEKKEKEHKHKGLDKRPSMHLLYIIPNDKAYREDYSMAMMSAMLNLQQWFATQLAGKTFKLNYNTPKVCYLPQNSSYYAIDSWSKIMADVQGCEPVQWNDPNATWVIYADVTHQCNTPGRLGAGTSGITMLPKQDLDGLIGLPILDCGLEYSYPKTRWIGGLGHELGHALGVPHPLECDQGLPTCDYNALMWVGYLYYPNTYFRSDEKNILLASPFIY